MSRLFFKQNFYNRQRNQVPNVNLKMTRSTLHAAVIVLMITQTLSADTVDSKTGRGFRGSITDMNANTVSVTTTSGKVEKIPAFDVMRITFDGEPNALRSARRNYVEGQYNRIEEVLSTVQPGNGFQTVEKAFLISMANSKLALRGENGKTIAETLPALESFIAGKNHNKWFQYFDALETLGDMYAASNQLDKALAQYQMLAKSSSEEVIMTGQFKAAQVNVYKSDFAAAKSGFEAIQGRKISNPTADRLKILAKVGAARSDAELGNSDASIKTLLALIKKEDPGDMELFGHAYNALGHSYQQAGQTKAALLAFLHTDVLYQRNPQIHSEALYQLVRLWQLDQKTTQSLDSRKLLREKYRNTFWGAKEISGK